ncbi:MAG TPA: hypothetical protein ENJ90_04520 [Devosia sp.]|nr:hypothetical protein [Devosia sp.]
MRICYHLYDIGTKKTQLKGKILDFSGSYLLLAKRQAVWQALNDTRVLQKVIPGCEYIEWTGANTLDLGIKVNLGLMRPVFGGELVLSEVDPSISYVLSGRGHGKMLGLARGEARITLSDTDLGPAISFLQSENEMTELLADWPRFGVGTLLEFQAEGSASGKIMALGKKLVGKSAQRVIDGFFLRFAVAMDTRVVSCPRAIPAPEAASSTSLERS